MLTQKNRGLILALLTIVLLITTLSSLTFAAESKIIKKTIHKVIAPQISVTPPAINNAASEEAPVISSAPIQSTNYETASLSQKIGLFKIGINTDIGALFQANAGGGILAGRGNLIFDDPWKLGEKIGLAEDAVEYKVGAALLFGNDNNGSSIKSIPVCADAVVYLKEGSLFGIDPFVGAGVNYNLLGSTYTIGGGIGGQLYGGILLDFGFNYGKSALALGINQFGVASRSASGLFVSLSQPVML